MSLRVSNFVHGDSGQWRLDILGAVGALVVAAILFPLQFLASNALLLTIPVVVGLASGAYLVSTHRARSSNPEINHEYWRFSSGTGHAVQMTVVVGLASMIFIGTVTNGRTLPFFGIAALVGTLIFIQILFQERTALNPSIILAEIVAFALIIRGIALLTTPGTIGVDSWVHIPTFADAIRQSGQLSAIADSKYFGAPLYHLLVVTAADAFNSTLRIALYATLGIVMPVSGLLIYYATRDFLPIRWALFATASFIMADHVIRWGLHLIPTSLGLVFFLGAFYTVGKIFTHQETRGLYALVLFFSLALVLTHHISAFVLLVFLGVGSIVQLSLKVFPTRTSVENVPQKSSRNVNFVGMFLFALPITVIIWAFTPPEGTSFLSAMLDSVMVKLGDAGFLELNSILNAASVETSEAIRSMAVTTPLTFEILVSLGFLLLLFATIVGSISLLHVKRRNLLSVTWMNSSALMLFVILGMPLFGLYFLIPGRWYAFAYVPMAVVGAFGMWELSRSMSARSFMAVMLLFALVFPGAMAVNQKATHDDPIVNEYSHQFAFTESELHAAHTISTLHPEEAMLRADQPYYLFFKKSKGLLAGPIEVARDGSFSSGYVVYRDYQSHGGTQVQFEDAMIRTQPSFEQVCRPSMDILYTNGEVQYCRSI